MRAARGSMHSLIAARLDTTDCFVLGSIHIALASVSSLNRSGEGGGRERTSLQLYIRGSGKPGCPAPPISCNLLSVR